MDALRPLVVLALLAPAGASQAVKVTVNDGKMTIKGSALEDILVVSGSRADGAAGALDIVVTPDGGTTVNGSTSPAVFTDVVSLKALLGGAEDDFKLENFVGPDFPVTVNGGPGSDVVQVIDSTTGDFKLSGASGDDVLFVDTSTLGATKVTDTSGDANVTANAGTFATLTVKTGALNDFLTWTDVTVDGDLVINLGAGDDTVSITGIAVSGETSVKLGGGGDSLTGVGGAFGGDVSVVAGAGNDLALFEDSALGGGLDAKLGGGANLLALIAEQGAVLVAGSVVVTGSPEGDQVVLVAEAEAENVHVAGDVVLELKSGDNIFQQSGDVSLGNDLLLTAASLDESIDCDGLQVSHDVTFLLAAGENEMTLNDCLIANDLTITCGPDDDTLQLTGTTQVGGTENIDLGGGET